MTKTNIKLYLDYIPFIILCISAGILIWTDIILIWKHYIGLISLPVIALLFYKNHLLGVLSLGLALLVGLMGFLSFSPAITTITFGYGNVRDWSVDLIRFQPIFLLWLIIHFALSGSLYVGILSKKYWQEIIDKYK